MIDELAILSPAEVLLIKNPAVEIGRLARITFLDLILKGVLVIEPIENFVRKKRTNPTISIGKQFFEYKPLKHESIFLKVFVKEPEIKIELSVLVKSAFEDISSSEDYKLNYIYTKERMKKYFKANIFQRILGVKVISDKGLQVQAGIKKELKRIKTNTTKETKNAVELLLQLNSNILLIPNIPTRIFNDLTKRKKQDINTESDTFLCSDYSNLFPQSHFLEINDTYFTSSIDTLDGFDSHDGTDGCATGTGCDSGCSGCGGCGG